MGDATLQGPSNRWLRLRQVRCRREKGARDFGFGYPLGFGTIKDPEVRARKLLIDLNNGRLAMIAFTGLVVQEGVTGQGIIDQLTSGHISPFNDGQGVFAFSGPYSLALPWAPVAEGLTNNPLDDTYVGDVGFDPLGFAKNKKLLPWYREAELTPDFAVTVGDFYTRQTPYAPPP